MGLSLWRGHGRDHHPADAFPDTDTTRAAEILRPLADGRAPSTPEPGAIGPR